MKTLLYNEDTTAILQYLKSNTPERIYSDEFYRVVFDYGDFHVTAMPEDFVANTQNDSDEAIAAKFERIESSFRPDNDDKLMFQNNSIDRLWILRTLLYFTDHILYSSEEEALANFDIEIESDGNKALADILRRATGGHDEVVCHPRSPEAENVSKDFANLVDAGVMLEIEGQLLMCFAWNNGFHVVGRIMSLDELKEEVAPSYDFIEL